MYLVMYVCLCMHVCSRRAAKLTTTDLVYGCAHGRAGKRREEKVSQRCVEDQGQGQEQGQGQG